MYVPAHFAETRREVLHAALRAAGLFTLVTSGSDGFDASHIPMILEAEEGQDGRLVGHLARPNGQWKGAPDGSPALAIALGPDAYVTPAWYPTKAESGRVVPTWNYVAIHVHGGVRFFHDRERLLDLVRRLTNFQEQGRPHPWSVSDAPPDYIDGMLKGIVGVELSITRIEGKWKASQNRSASDQQGVADGLRRDGHEDMARVMGGMKQPE
jgi:transcriptional regulator